MLMNDSPTTLTTWHVFLHRWCSILYVQSKRETRRRGLGWPQDRIVGGKGKEESQQNRVDGKFGVDANAGYFVVNVIFIIVNVCCSLSLLLCLFLPLVRLPLQTLNIILIGQS